MNSAPFSKAYFIVIEGLEGAGKTTALSTIQDVLSEAGVAQIHTTREPGGTPIAESLRALVKEEHAEEALTAEAECLLMYAARMQLVRHVIEPKLKKGTWVIGDRHDMSSRAYQGGGRQLNDLVDQISQATLKDFKPDLTFYLDIEPKVGLERARLRGALDRIEKEDLDFFNRTRARYLELTEQDPNTILIDANQSLEGVTRDLRQKFSERLASWK
jgi:dTMP kinase